MKNPKLGDTIKVEDELMNDLMNGEMTLVELSYSYVGKSGVIQTQKFKHHKHPSYLEPSQE